MTDETRRCEWCGDISQGACDCPANAEIERLQLIHQQHAAEIGAELERLRATILAMRKELRWYAQGVQTFVAGALEGNNEAVMATLELLARDNGTRAAAFCFDA